MNMSVLIARWYNKNLSRKSWPWAVGRFFFFFIHFILHIYIFFRFVFSFYFWVCSLFHSLSLIQYVDISIYYILLCRVVYYKYGCMLCLCCAFFSLFGLLLFIYVLKKRTKSKKYFRYMYFYSLLSNSVYLLLLVAHSHSNPIQSTLLFYSNNTNRNMKKEKKQSRCRRSVLAKQKKKNKKFKLCVCSVVLLLTICAICYYDYYFAMYIMDLYSFVWVRSQSDILWLLVKNCFAVAHFFLIYSWLLLFHNSLNLYHLSLMPWRDFVIIIMVNLMREIVTACNFPW